MEKKKKKGISIRIFNWIMIFIATIIASVLVVSLYLLNNEFNDVKKSTTLYTDWKSGAMDVRMASDYLTEEVRSFVVTGKEEYINAYFNESKVTKRREKVLNEFKNHIGNSLAYKNLENAVEKSMDLMAFEYHAMKLTIEAYGYDINKFYDEVKNYELPANEAALTSEEKLEVAKELVYGNEYERNKNAIKDKLNDSLKELDSMLEHDVIKSSEKLAGIMIFQQSLVLLLIVFLVVVFVFVYTQIVHPITLSIHSILSDTEIKVTGSSEYRQLADTYNTMWKNNKEIKAKLSYEAEHDNLTGLYNRNGYDSVFGKLELKNSSYVLVDIDNFKKINDKYGHIVGDKVLKKVGELLNEKFSEDCCICRIGGDEFAMLVSNSSKITMDEIKERTIEINRTLKAGYDEIPPVTLSIGVAIGTEKDNTDTLFKKADIALYYTKNNGRADANLYNENMENE